jgi:hypothetical protein
MVSSSALYSSVSFSCSSPVSGLQAHVEDFLDLHVRELVAVFEQTFVRGQVFRTREFRAGFAQQCAHQPRLPALREQSFARLVRIRRSLDQLDHLVDVGERDREAFQHVGATARLAQLEDRATRDDFATMAHEGFEDVLQVEQLRLAVEQRHHVDAEHGLHLRLLEQVVQHHLGLLAALDLDDDAHAVLVGLVAQTVGRDALDLLVLDQLGDLLDQPRLVHLVRQLGDDDGSRPSLSVLDLGLARTEDAAAAGAIGLEDAGAPLMMPAVGKSGPGTCCISASMADLGIVDDRDGGVDHFGQVVRRDVRGHADRDAGGTVDQQVRDTRRQDRRFQFLLVVVRREVDGFLVDVGEQLVRELGHARFGVTHRRGGIAVDRTEVALAVDQQVAQRERLRHAHQVS